MKGHAVLLVDDDEVVIKLLESTFAKSTYRVLTANNGPQALAPTRCAAWRPGAAMRREAQVFWLAACKTMPSAGELVVLAGIAIMARSGSAHKRWVPLPASMWGCHNTENGTPAYEHPKSRRFLRQSRAIHALARFSSAKLQFSSLSITAST